jgi:hypothetical protein
MPTSPSRAVSRLIHKGHANLLFLRELVRLGDDRLRNQALRAGGGGHLPFVRAIRDFLNGEGHLSSLIELPTFECRLRAIPIPSRPSSSASPGPL